MSRLPAADCARTGVKFRRGIIPVRTAVRAPDLGESGGLALGFKSVHVVCSQEGTQDHDRY